MLDKQMRLEELLGREVTIRWFEGVALIQAVCRQLLAHDGPTTRFRRRRKSCSRRTETSPP